MLWRRGSNVLTAAAMKVTTDDRIRLINGFNLEIAELEPQDAGKRSDLAPKKIINSKTKFPFHG